MDTHLIQAATSQVQKLMPSKSGKGEYELAIAAPKLSDSPDDEIKKVLRFSMLLIGIRASTIASMEEEEKQILILFLKSKFGIFTLDEVKIAFTKACAGELDVDARPFENFTCEYIGRIMNAYKQWAVEESRILRSRKREEELMLQNPQYSDCIDLTNTYYQEFLKDEFNFRTATTICWDKMRERFNIIFDREKNNGIILQAKSIYLEEQDNLLEKYGSTSFVYIHAKKVKQEVSNTENENLLSNVNILNWCKRIGLLEWFKILKEQNVNSIYEYAEQNKNLPS